MFLNITPELKAEGQVRELIRAIQELRKQEKLNPGDAVSLKVKTDRVGESLIKKFESEIKQITMIKAFSFGEADNMTEIKIDELALGLKILK